MPKNPGKMFEEDFISSVPVHYYTYRFRDSAGTWQGGDNTRFTASNICDFLVFAEGKLFLLELKSHKGKSLPVNCIRENQLKQLVKAASHKDIRPYIIVNFRDTSETYAVNVADILEFIEKGERKSIPLDYCRERGKLIPQSLKKVRWRYYPSELLEGDINANANS